MTISAPSAPGMATTAADLPSTFTDIRGMQAMSTNSPESLKKVAAQFESLFLDMWLQSMRDAGSVFAEGNPFSSQAVQVHQQMLDHQYAVHLSEAGGIGIGDALVAQLSPQQSVGQRESDDSAAMAALMSRRVPAMDSSVATQSFGTRASLFDGVQDFIAQLLPVFQQALERSALNPTAVLAQAALETGWGQKVIHDQHGRPSFNLFGIKSHDWQGESASLYSLEHEFGRMVPRQAEFRVYENWQHSVNDYQAFLEHDGRYAQVLEAAGNPEQFAAALQSSGYATDPNYAGKLMDVVNSITRHLQGREGG